MRVGPSGALSKMASSYYKDRRFETVDCQISRLGNRCLFSYGIVSLIYVLDLRFAISAHLPSSKRQDSESDMRPCCMFKSVNS